MEYLKIVSTAISFTRMNCLPRDEGVKLLKNGLRKVYRTSFCLRYFSGIRNRNCDSDHSTIGAIQFYSIRDQIYFAPIFAWRGPAVCLVPIQNQDTIHPFTYDIPIRDERPAICPRYLDETNLQRRPASARQAVLRRVDRISRSLGGIISNKKSHRRLFRRWISELPFKKLACPENL